ncbi:MAG TPA: TIGR03564 family F420-dependent LLM class oxidoreductase [Acidimicrobiales bacterium]
MRIGLNGGGKTVERMIEQAKRAEAEGFTSLWYPSAVAGDPVTPMAVAGRATTSIELGTAVLQTYTSHPVLQAGRIAAAASAMGRPGFTLGIGPSHQPVIEGMFGMSYATPGRHTEEYVRIVTSLLHGQPVNLAGEELTLRGATPPPVEQPVTVLVSALAPRLLRVAGEVTDGTILWMANARAVETHVAPRITKAAAAAGRPAPRIVAGLPVAVHDDVDEAREVAARQFATYGILPNYQRILAHGGVSGPAEAAIVGDEASVAAQLQGLVDAGATDIWAAIFPVGDDAAGSRRRTRELLRELVAAG